VCRSWDPANPGSEEWGSAGGDCGGPAGDSAVANVNADHSAEVGAH
jgi:hypothetical protein